MRADHTKLSGTLVGFFYKAVPFSSVTCYEEGEMLITAGSTSFRKAIGKAGGCIFSGLFGHVLEVFLPNVSPVSGQLELCVLE